MTRSLFILMLVAFMAAVGMYYERKAGPRPDSELTAMRGAAVLADSAAQAPSLAGDDLTSPDAAPCPPDDTRASANQSPRQGIETGPVNGGGTADASTPSTEPLAPGDSTACGSNRKTR